MISSSGGRDSFLIQERQQHRRFGLAIALAQARAKNFDGLLQFVWRDGRAGEQKYAQARIVEFSDFGEREHCVERSGRQKNMRDVDVARCFAATSSASKASAEPHSWRR